MINLNAIYTSCNDGFYEGLKVMLYSFYKHNSEFKGDVIIGFSKNISPLSKSNQEELLKIFKNKLNIKLRDIDEKTYKNVFKVVPEQNKRFIPAMFIFEMFKFDKYNKIIYVDADIIIRKNLNYLFESKEQLMVFKDGDTKELCINESKYTKDILKSETILKKIKRMYISFKRMKLVKNFHSKTLIIWKVLFYIIEFIFRVDSFDADKDHYFNSGFVVIGNKYLGNNWFKEIINFSLIQKNPFFPDQDILNSFVLKKFEKINYLSSKDNGIKVKYENSRFENFNEKNPLFVHFVGKKPWQDISEQDVFYKLFKFKLIGGRKVEFGYRVDENYSKINELWFDYKKELDNLNK